jgi:hypothetical protein
MANHSPATAQKALQTTLRKLEKATPGFRTKWMLWGTSAIAGDVIRPQANIPLVSIDLDFRSQAVSAPIQEEISGIKKAFPKQTIHEADLEFGLLRTATKDEETGLLISIDLMSSDEETSLEKTEPSQSFDNFPRQSLESYIRNKLACLTERLEEKDILHLFFLSQTDPQRKKIIEAGLRKLPSPTLAAHQKALNQNWESITNKCIWGKLPETANITQFNSWLRTILLKSSGNTLRPQTHAQNRPKTRS